MNMAETAQEQAERVGNLLLEKFGFIAIAVPTGATHKRGDVLRNKLPTNDGSMFAHALVVIGESSFDEYQQHRKEIGQQPAPEDYRGRNYYRVAAE